uniref:C-type lectin domain-containing protein n=1 Tax=Strigamia maritima TaxID=126957 RepID=T1JH15_STRMM
MELAAGQCITPEINLSIAIETLKQSKLPYISSYSEANRITCSTRLVSFRRWKSHETCIPKVHQLAWFSPVTEYIFKDWCPGAEPTEIDMNAVIMKKCWKMFRYDIPSYTYRFCSDNKQNLANIDNEKLSTDMMNEVKNRKINYWIGLKNFKQYGLPITKWYWNSTGNEVTYQNWCHPQTYKYDKYYKNKWCGYINVNEQCWKAEVCDRDYGIICRVKKRTRQCVKRSQPFRYKVQSYVDRTIQQYRPISSDYWIGAEAYTMVQKETELVYWKWNNTGIDIEYDNWCPDQIITKDLVCAYFIADRHNACWMFSNCEKTSTVSGFICEDKLKHTDEYDIVYYKDHEYLIYNKCKNKCQQKNWYQVRDICRSKNKNLLTLDTNDKVDFFNRIFLVRNITVWLGLETYVQIVNGNRYMYWRWTGTGSDIGLKNWCPNSNLQKEAMCGYVTLDNMCWMAESCNHDDVMTFVCEDMDASDANAAPAFQHYLAVPYHKGK